MTPSDAESVDWRVREPLTNEQLNALFSEAYAIDVNADFAPILSHSLTWVTAWRDGRLVGFVNVAWDGLEHAFLVDRSALPSAPDVRRALLTRAIDAVAADHPSIGKVHLDCDEDEVDGLADRGFVRKPAGIAYLNPRPAAG